MTTTNGALTLSGLGQRTFARRPLGRSVAVAADPVAAHPTAAHPTATQLVVAAPVATGLLSDRAMVAFVVVKETAAALAITALVLAAILL